MASNATTQLRLTLGAVRLEYEGRDEFLKSEVPPLVQAMDRLVTSRLIVPCNVLQAAIQDSFTSQKDIDDAIVGMKNDLDSMSELGEAESLRLQMAMDRLSKLMSTLSNISKKTQRYHRLDCGKSEVALASGRRGFVHAHFTSNTA
jgi:hypothetical protein